MRLVILSKSKEPTIQSNTPVGEVSGKEASLQGTNVSFRRRYWQAEYAQFEGV